MGIDRENGMESAMKRADFNKVLGETPKIAAIFKVARKKDNMWLPDAVLDGEFICHSVHISGSPTFRSLINGSYYSIAPSSMRFVEYRQVAGKPILPIQEQQS